MNKNFTFLFIICLMGLNLNAFAQWQGYYGIGGQTAYQPISLFVPSNGYMQLPAGNSPYGYFWTIFENNINVCVGNSFVVEIRMMNTAGAGGLDAYDSSLSLQGNCGTVWATLMGSGWAQQYTSAGLTHTVYPNNYVSNQGSLVQNLSTFGILRMEVSPSTIIYKWNGSVICTLPCSYTIGQQIEQIRISFKGSGSVDWLKIWDSSNTLIYSEDFEDTIFAASSPCAYTLPACNAPLPIELISFSSTTDQNQNVLSWKTAKEIDFKGFEVEKSADNLVYENIAFIEAKGENETYTYSDVATQPLLHYRLKMIDTDGFSRYSNSVEVYNASNMAVGNPYFVENELNIPIETVENQMISIEFWDIQGKAIFSETKTISSGNTSLNLECNVSKGIYYVVVIAENGERFVRKVLK